MLCLPLSLRYLFSNVSFCLNLIYFKYGIPSVQRAIINIKDKDDPRGKKGDKEMLVEGYGLQKVMVTDGSYSHTLLV